MTWEKKQKSKFQQNPSIPSLTQNLMTMEQYKLLTTQPILSRGSKTWEKKQKSQFQQNTGNPSLSWMTW